MLSRDKENSEGPWSHAALTSRIDESATHTRYEAGSPNESELAAYDYGIGSGIEPGAQRDLAVVFGMTPELIRLALKRFSRVIVLDRNIEAIELYKDWLPRDAQERLTILCEDWFELQSFLPRPPDAILGDGIFGNLPDLETHGRLLRQLLGALAPNAPLIVRKALIPRAFDPETERFETLLERHRRGELDASEFGFATRLLGHSELSYDPENFVLHNARTFASCEDSYRNGLLKQSEWAAIRRYFFEGDNCILPQEIWEQELAQAGFDFIEHRCYGKDWYRYYPVYACRRRTLPSSDENSESP